MAAEASVVIGIASSTIAFFNFATKVAKATKAIHDAGGELPEDVQLCHTLVQDFSKLLRRLENGIQQPRVSQSLQEAETDFQQLIEDCSGTVQELLIVLQSLNPMKNPLGRVRWLAKLRSGIKIARKEGKTQRIQSRLSSYKELLLFLMLERMLNSSSTTKSAVQQLHDHEVALRSETQHEHKEIIDSVVSQDCAFVGLQSSVVHFKSSLNHLRSGSDEGLAIARQILEVANAGQMDPNYIYIAIPKMPLSPLPMWYSCVESVTNRLAQATRRLRLSSSGGSYTRDPLALVKQEPTGFDGDKSSLMTLHLTVRGEACSTTLQLDMGGEMTDTRFIEILSRAYTENAGWKPWLTLQRLSCIRFTQMMTSANREMKLIHYSTRERKLSTNFLGWYMYESPLESEHYRLPWFQSSSEEKLSPSDASSPFTTSAFEEPSTEDLILEETEELPNMCEQNHLKEILQLTSRARRTRQDQGIGQPLVKLLPETLRQDSQRLGEAGGEILWSVELEGDFDLNTLWCILLTIGSVGSYYIYPDLQRLLRIYVNNLQGRLVDAGCLEIVVVPTPQLTLFPKAFACGFMSGNTFLVMLASWQAGQRLIPKCFKIGPWLWLRESDTQTQFDYAVSAGLLLTPVILWALQVGIERNGWWPLPPSSPPSNDSNLSWTNALFLGVLMAFPGALLPIRFSKTQRCSLGRTFQPWTWDAVAIENTITRIVPLIFVAGWTLNLFQVTNALQITLGRISPVCALQFADVEWAQDFPILVRTIMLIALDIASRFLVEADLASPITTRDEDPERKLNAYAFGFMVVLLGIFIATFRW